MKPPQRIAAVLLVGGKGDRFWPSARAGTPKPLLAIAGARAMLRETAERIAPLASRILAVVDAEAADRVTGPLAGIEPGVEIVREPSSRSTAPALGLAAVRASSDDVLVALPSDHHIPDAHRFRDAVAHAATLAAARAGIVCIGIAPTRAETGYGYIIPGDPLPGIPGCAIASFVEKPPAQRAARLVEDGALWNSGIFVVRAGVYLRMVEQYMPELHRALEAVRGGDEAAFAEAPAVSVDHGLLEVGVDAYAVRADFAWDDLGDWGALARILPRDAAGNATRGAFAGVEARHNIVDSDAGLVAAVGVEDITVIRRGEIVLVVKRGQERLVPRLVQQLQGAALEPFR